MTQTPRQKFDALDSQRRPMLDRCREFAALSIPSVLPEEKLWETSELPVPFSSATARGLNRLAGRILSALVPMNNQPFFNLQLDEAEPIEGRDPTPEQVAMGRLERRIMTKLSQTNFRSMLFNAIIRTAITGTTVIYQHENYNFSQYRLDNVVIRRRPDGEWTEVGIREYLDPYSLPDFVKAHGFVDSPDEAGYTQACLDDGNAMYSFIRNDFKGGCSVKRWYKDKEVDSGDHAVCPYVVARWLLVDGENYGRGLIEDNCGDIRAVESMTEALLDSIAANAEFRFGVNPAGLTELHDLQESTNGSFVAAGQNDVFPIQLGAYAQVEMTQRSVSLKEETLGHVFLQNSVVQPQGDRVTRAQVMLIATELEQALGGVFSDAAREILIPIIRMTMARMLKDKTLIPDGDIASDVLAEELRSQDGILQIKVKTGLESLSREVENEKMMRIMDVASKLPEPGQRAMIWPGIINRWLSTEGLETKGLHHTVEELAQQDQQAQQQALAQQAGQQAIQTGGAIAEQAATAPTSEGQR